MKQILVLLFAMAIMFVGCGGESEKIKTAKTLEKESVKVEKIKLTVERYCMIDKEKSKLLMETYWEQFKGKKYEDVKDTYAQYNKEIKAIELKYDINEKDELNSFFKKNYKEIYKYPANDPEYIKYPEHNEAKKVLMELAMSKYKENMEKSLND